MKHSVPLRLVQTGCQVTARTRGLRVNVRLSCYYSVMLFYCFSDVFGVVIASDGLRYYSLGRSVTENSSFVRSVFKYQLESLALFKY